MRRRRVLISAKHVLISAKHIFIIAAGACSLLRGGAAKHLRQEFEQSGARCGGSINCLLAGPCNFAFHAKLRVLHLACLGLGEKHLWGSFGCPISVFRLPDRIRTCDLKSRSLARYPAEPRVDLTLILYNYFPFVSTTDYRAVRKGTKNEEPKGLLTEAPLYDIIISVSTVRRRSRERMLPETADTRRKI